MPKQYVVTSPYVTLKTETPDGWRLLGFYRDAPVPPDVDQGVLDRHVEAGMISEVPGPEDEPLPEPPPSPGEQANLNALPPVERPLNSAPKADWVDYAVSQGMERSSAEALTKGQLQDACTDQETDQETYGDQGVSGGEYPYTGQSDGG